MEVRGRRKALPIASSPPRLPLLWGRGSSVLHQRVLTLVGTTPLGAPDFFFFFAEAGGV